MLIKHEYGGWKKLAQKSPKKYWHTNEFLKERKTKAAKLMMLGAMRAFNPRGAARIGDVLRTIAEEFIGLVPV